MSTKLIVASVITAGLLGAATAAFAGPSASGSAASKIGDALPLAGAVTEPDWLSKPSGDDLSRLYPPLANVMLLDGAASMQCAVSSAGDLQDCKIVAEAPLGVGFGAATLQAASTFKMKPMTLDGAPVGGATVTVPIRWRLEDMPPSPSSTQAPRTEAPAEKLALARRVAELTGARQPVTKYYGTLLERVTQSEAEQGLVTDTAAHRLAVSAFQDAATAGSARYADRIAAAYADQFTEPELREILGFLQTPPGKHFGAFRPVLSESVARQLYAETMRDARLRFCSQAACTPAASAGKGGG